MDPGTIINVVTLVVQLLDLIRDACKDGPSKRRKRCQAELLLFRTQLHENLQFAHDIKEQAVAVGFKSKSIEKLQNELQELVSSVKNRLSSKDCKKEDIRQLRELAMSTLQYRMEQIVIEMCIKSYEDVKAIKEMITKKQDEQEMVSKNHGVQINIFQGQARANPMLTGPLSYVTETLWECFSRVFADEHLNLVVPTEASKDKAGPYVHLFRVADVGMIKGVEVESGTIKEGAAKYGPKEEDEKFLLTKEGAENDVLEEKKRRKEALVKDMERPSAADDVLKEEEEKKNKKKKEAFLTKEGAGMDKERKEAPLLKDMERPGRRTTERQDDEGQDNPNRNMELTIEEGKGELLMSKLEGSQLEMTYKWCGESMRMVIGKRQMEVSKKLGYFYFEVKLVEMAELLEGSETGLAGMGVGLARLDKFRTSKMAGRYSKSCGYDGRVGEVYYESRVQEGPSRMGCLAMGDTLGIGLLEHDGQHPIFFVKNGELQVCIQDHSLCAPSSHGGLHPVISLASAHVQLHVNFQGPFELSELVVQVKAALAHK